LLLKGILLVDRRGVREVPSVKSTEEEKVVASFYYTRNFAPLQEELGIFFSNMQTSKFSNMTMLLL
jgi:hypothetical protein